MHQTPRHTARDIGASIRHGISNLTNFSGRDTPAQFRTYAGLLLILAGAAAYLFFIPRIMAEYVRMERYAAAHPDRTSVAIQAGDLSIGTRVPGWTTDFQSLAFALCAIVLVYLALIAAALARRRHAFGAAELAFALAPPLLAAVLAAWPLLIPLIMPIATLAGTLYILIRGGAPERVSAVAMLIVGVGTLAIFGDRLRPFQGIEPIFLIPDGFGFVASVLIALRANRLWTIWVAALVGVGLLVHLAALANPQLLPWAYLTAEAIWGYPLLVAMIVGTRGHRLRLARDGSDPAWTPWRQSGA